jgi:hypothetical protein
MTNAYRPTTDRVHEQVALYEATEGREGGTLEGRSVVILSTIGAKTGNPEEPVMRIKDGDTYVAVASNGGASSNPSWYRNLTAHPDALVAVAEGDCPRYEEFRAKAGDREIPVIVLEPL